MDSIKSLIQVCKNSDPQTDKEKILSWFQDLLENFFKEQVNLLIKNKFSTVPEKFWTFEKKYNLVLITYDLKFKDLDSLMAQSVWWQQILSKLNFSSHFLNKLSLDNSFELISINLNTLEQKILIKLDKKQDDNFSKIEKFIDGELLAEYIVTYYQLFKSTGLMKFSIKIKYIETVNPKGNFRDFLPVTDFNCWIRNNSFYVEFWPEKVFLNSNYLSKKLQESDINKEIIKWHSSMKNILINWLIQNRTHFLNVLEKTIIEQTWKAKLEGTPINFDFYLRPKSSDVATPSSLSDYGRLDIKLTLYDYILKLKPELLKINFTEEDLTKINQELGVKGFDFIYEQRKHYQVIRVISPF